MHFKMRQGKFELSTLCVWSPHISLLAAVPIAAHSLLVLDTFFLLARASQYFHKEGKVGVKRPIIQVRKLRFGEVR